MLRRPRRTRFLRFFKSKGLRPWGLRARGVHATLLQSRRYLKVSWRLFELIRLRLAWVFGRRHRGSRKSWYKQGRQQAKARRERERSVARGPARRRLAARRCFWYAGFPHVGYSAKTKGTRMGKGKGTCRQWYQPLHPGSPLLRLRGVHPLRARYILRGIGRRLPGVVLRAPAA